jgi:hypothetical protein
MSYLSKHKDQEIEILQRKLGETEARVAARILSAAQRILPPDYYILLSEEIGKIASLDALEIERQIAARAKTVSDSLEAIHAAVKSFKRAKDDYDEVSRSPLTDVDVVAKCQRCQDNMVRAREKLFSLLAEHEIRKNVETAV